MSTSFETIIMLLLFSTLVDAKLRSVTVISNRHGLVTDPTKISTVRYSTTRQRDMPRRQKAFAPFAKPGFGGFKTWLSDALCSYCKKSGGFRCIAIHCLNSRTMLV